MKLNRKDSSIKRSADDNVFKLFRRDIIEPIDKASAVDLKRKRLVSIRERNAGVAFVYTLNGDIQPLLGGIIRFVDLPTASE